MPLGVFVGTNHHLQSTIFVVSLIRDEDAKSFKWLFDTFVWCMNNKHPTCILIGEFKKNSTSFIIFSVYGSVLGTLVLSENNVKQAVQPLLAQKSNKNSIRSKIICHMFRKNIVLDVKFKYRNHRSSRTKTCKGKNM